MESEMTISLDQKTVRSQCSSRILQLHAHVYASALRFRRPTISPFQNPNIPQMPHLVPGLQLVNEYNVSSYGSTLDEDWTQTEHELFAMGLMMYGRGHCEKIARYFVWTKTTEEVHHYDEKFFRLFSFMNSYDDDAHLSLSLSSGVEMGRNENGTSASTMFSNPLIPNETPKTLKLFPENASFSLATQARDAERSIYAFQKETYNGTTSMNVTNEVDLELHLG